MNVNPICLIVLPLFAAFLIPFIEMFIKKSAKYITILTEISALYMIYTFIKAGGFPYKVIIAGYRPPIGISLYVTLFSLILTALIYGLGFIVTLFEFDGRERSYKFFIVFLLMLAGLSGLTLTSDIFNMFVFFEIISIASYVLVALGRHEHSAEAGIKYLVIGSVGSTFLLLGIAFIYAMTGTLNIADIAKHLNGGYLTIMSMFFIFLGLGVKAEIFPLNSWVPDSYEAADFEIAGFLASIVPKIALLVIMRIFVMFAVSPYLLKIMLILGILGLLAGEFAAYNQKNIFRMLAYSSIAQMSFIFMILSVYRLEAFSAAFLQAFLHLIVKFFLFAIAGAWFYAYGIRNIEDLKGISKKSPCLSISFLVLVLTILGIPPTIGFYAKYYAISAMIKVAPSNFIYYFAVFAVALSVAVEAGYFLRVIQNMFFYERNIEGKKLNVIHGVLGVLAGVFIIWISFYPNELIAYVKTLSAIFTDKATYIQKILG